MAKKKPQSPKKDSRTRKPDRAKQRPKKRSAAAAEPQERFPIVGIGASAGGLSALKTFFAHTPRDPGVAFVVVVHLSPEHESRLADLLQPHCKMPVQQVTETVEIQPNCVYVIPPNANLNTIDTHLRLSELEPQPKDRATIDHFFRTLAETHDGDAVGVVLSGTGSDGTLGLRRIKEAGGLTIAQDPEEAEHDGMPRSAITSGMVDLVLPVREIPGATIKLARSRPQVPIPDEGEPLDRDENRLLQKIYAQVRARTGHDFSQYKRSTILRRIHRRMQLKHVETLPAYLELLRTDRSEVKDLFDDLLITVTEFFRDRVVFEYLEQTVIPALFDGKSTDDRIRVWSVGCSTGEEAYSLAMLLLEAAGKRETHPQLQVFASDLHASSLGSAREGVYPAEISADVSPERLRRFFIPENGHYRVRREVRELVVFAEHNLLRDPPFSHLDLIVCRNLLIYLQRDVQQDVVGIFHYALNPDGLLVLGTSETIDRAELFRCENKEACLFRKRNVPSAGPLLTGFPPRLLSPADRRLEREAAAADRGEAPAGYGGVHERMVERYAPPSVLVNERQEVVHSSAHAGRFLELPGGEPTHSLFKLVREPLKIELRTAMHEANQSGSARSRTVRMELDGKRRQVVMRVHAASDPELSGYMLVIFDELDEPSLKGDGGDGDGTQSATVRELEHELTLNRQRLQAAIEEYESSREEMQASNEELQSANEELRSTMEELETSKEELQSMNEELTTLNQENRHRVEELGQLSADLQNLLASTDIATLFLDRELRIVRFTPQVGELFNIRHTDRGRPLSDLTHRLGDESFVADAREVLARLAPVEREMQSEGGQWYLTRILPYRGLEDRIEGVVITMIDITGRKAAEERLRESEDRLRKMVNVPGVGVMTFGSQGTLIDANDAFLEMTGYRREQVQARRLSWRDMTPAEFIEESERQLRVLAETGRIGPYEKEYIHADGSRSWMLSAGADLGDGTVVEYCIDVSNRKTAEQELARSKEYSESIVQTLHEPLLVLNRDLTVRSANAAFYEHFQVDSSATEGRRVYDLGNGQWNIPALRTLLEDVLPANHVFNDYEVEHEFVSIGRRVMLLNARQLADVQLILLGIRDITQRKAVEEELRALTGQLESRIEQRVGLIGTLLKISKLANEAEVLEPMLLEALELIGRHNEWVLGHVWLEPRFLPGGSVTEADGVLDDSGIWWSADPGKYDALVRECDSLRWRRGESVIGEVFESGETVFVPDVSARGDLVRGAVATRLGLRTMYAFPIRLADEIVGVMEFFSPLVADRDEALLEAMADAGIQIGRVLERMELERQIADRTVREQERVSSELHDSVGQQLVGTKMLADTLAEELAQDRAPQAEMMRRLAAHLDETLNQVRRISRGLRPVDVDELGLMTALQQLADRCRETHGIQCRFECPNPVRLHDPAAATHLFHIAQEATQNALRHGEPAQVVIGLERIDGEMVLEVRDDGRGFDPTDKSHGLGQRIMRHRASLIGGDLEVESEHGKGTTVRCTVKHAQ